VEIRLNGRIDNPDFERASIHESIAQSVAVQEKRHQLIERVVRTP